MTPLAATARAIFAQALEAVDAGTAVSAQIWMDVSTVTLAGVSIPRAQIDRIFLIAVGKAATPMYHAARLALAPLPLEAVVVGTAVTGHPGFFPGSHPTPDHHSARAAAAVLALLRQATQRTVVLFLISGGASAMLEQPLAPLTVDDLAAFHRALVGSGLPITQMNALRKHVSAVKGGRLAEAAVAARLQVTLLISDVPTATPEAIGSGPSLPDPSTIEDCRALLPRVPSVAPAILNFFADPACPETPKPGAFARSTWRVILSGDDLATAAANAARAAGFHVAIDHTPDDWEYREAGRYLLRRSAALAAEHPRSCLISVGEVAVALNADPGEGGRNSQFALWAAAEAARRGERVTILSAGSDGIDGHSPAAGAVCHHTTITQAAALGLAVESALATFNTAPLLRALANDIVTGPTGINLRDLRLFLREQ